MTPTPNTAPTPLPEGQARAMDTHATHPFDVMNEAVRRITGGSNNFRWTLDASAGGNGLETVAVLNAFRDLIVQQSRAVSPEVREREREALTKCERWLKSGFGRDIEYGEEVGKFRDREYPLPAALTPPSVTPACNACGGPLPEGATFTTHGQHQCFQYLASQVAALAAQVRGAK